MSWGDIQTSQGPLINTCRRQRLSTPRIFIMKIYEDVLPPKLLKKCIEELKSYQQSEVWGISNFFWTEELQIGLVGNVSTTPMPGESAFEIH